MTFFHLSTFVLRQTDKYGDKTAFRHRDDKTGAWIPTSWKVFSDKTDKAAKAFAKLNVAEQSNVALFSQNKPEIFISEFALYKNRAVAVPLYATSSVEQIEYIINDAEVAVLMVGEQEQYDKAYSLLGKNAFLKQLIIFDSNVKPDPSDSTSLFFDEFLHLGEVADNDALINERVSKAKSDDLATLIYTSGTTGEPKGVMLHHSNYMEVLRIHEIRLQETTDQDVSVCFLPLTHIFEKAWSYFCLYKGVRIDINLRPAEIQRTLKEVRPTLMCSVPRFWEKVYSGIQDKMAQSGKFTRWMMNAAVCIGRKRNLDYARYEKVVPFWFELPYQLFDRLVFQKLKKTVGIENGNYFPVAGAALSDNINEFFHACGIDILYGYGLTETSASVSCYFKKGYKVGSVGVEMPGVDVKIGENNEILVKGKTVMSGYYKKPEETAKVFTPDGWFKTGDAGTLSENGVLSMTERLKDLIKTSNGKYVAPQALELRIGEDKYIEQIAVIGDQRTYITALIIPAYDALKEYAAAKQIQFHNMEDLLRNGTINHFIQERVNEMQKNFAKFEQIKRFTLLPYPFTLEGGELTNTLKLRRAYIMQRYSSEIERMYEN